MSNSTATSRTPTWGVPMTPGGRRRKALARRTRLRGPRSSSWRGGADRTSTSSRPSSRRRKTRSARLQRKARQVEDSARDAGRGLWPSHSQADRGLRRGHLVIQLLRHRGFDALCTGRCGRRSSSRRPRKGSARPSCERLSRRSCASDASGNPSTQPIFDLNTMEVLATRCGPAGHRFRKPRAPLRVRRRPRGHLGPRQSAFELRRVITKDRKATSRSEPGSGFGGAGARAARVLPAGRPATPPNPLPDSRTEVRLPGPS